MTNPLSLVEQDHSDSAVFAARHDFTIDIVSVLIAPAAPSRRVRA
jgi:hypothetical protein